MSVYLLIDNGSKKAEATLRLRELAKQLSNKTNIQIHAVSLQHADAIDTCLLNNCSAETFTFFLSEKLQQGKREFVVIPLFFGASRALTSYIPEQIAELEKQFGQFNINIADVIFPLSKGEPRLADILYDHILSLSQNKAMQHKNVVLVDHGSPVKEITDVRKQVALRLQNLLGEKVSLEQAVMERREGTAYDFNGGLLEDWLETKALEGITNIIVAMLFFLPGRHAGECGDIEEICQGVMDKHPKLQISISPLISEHEMLVSILEDRVKGVC